MQSKNLSAEAVDIPEPPVIEKLEKEKQKERSRIAAGASRSYRIRMTLCAAVAVGILAMLFHSFVRIYRVPSASMEPTLMTGDTIIAVRYPFGETKLKKGDITVFEEESSGTLLVKRTVATEGDVISFEDGIAYINGEEEDTSYIDCEVYTAGAGSYEVPEGCIFVLGDNRENSSDSRFMDNPYISKDNVQSVVFLSFGTNGGFHIRFYM